MSAKMRRIRSLFCAVLAVLVWLGTMTAGPAGRAAAESLDARETVGERETDGPNDAQANEESEESAANNGPDENNEDEEDEWDDELFGEDYRVYWVDYDYHELSVGNPTPLQGRFFTTLWGGTTSDLDIQSLIHGYNLVLWDGNLGRFRINHRVVTGAVAEDDARGNRTYHIVLQKDLLYSDGTQVTAWDYAFSMLFQMDPAVADAGGTPLDESYLLGAAEYAAGQTRSVKGIRVLDDWSLDVTVRADALPYFYELSRLSVYPYPRHVIAPDSRVLDDGQGSYLAPALTGDTIRRYVLDSYTGYLTHPSVSSGPYTIQDFDGRTVSLALNSYFVGDEQGVLPRIYRLYYTGANRDTMVEDLGNGEYGLLNKVTWAPAILQGVRLEELQGHQYTMSTYPRNGLTLARLSARSEQLQDLAVRRALALCMDREEISRMYVGPYGIAVNGLYGLGQWTFATLNSASYPISENGKSDEDIEAEQEAWGRLSERLEALDPYELNIEEAVLELEESGWNLNTQGEPFEEGHDTVRCKRMENGTLLSLRLLGAVPQTEAMQKALEASWVENLRRAGILLTLEPAGMAVLTEAYQTTSETEYDLVIVGEDFPIAYDPTGFFTLPEELSAADASDSDALPAVYARIADQANVMSHTPNTDLLTYLTRWVDMQEEINRSIPLIPIYSNVYFDFYTREVHGYDIVNHTTWGEALQGVAMSSAGVLAAEEAQEIERELREMEELFEELETAGFIYE